MIDGIHERARHSLGRHEHASASQRLFRCANCEKRTRGGARRRRFCLAASQATRAAQRSAPPTLCLHCRCEKTQQRQSTNKQCGLRNKQHEAKAKGKRREMKERKKKKKKANPNGATTTTDNDSDANKQPRTKRAEKARNERNIAFQMYEGEDDFFFGRAKKRVRTKFLYA